MWKSPLSGLPVVSPAMPLRRPGRESITRMDRRDFLKRAAMSGAMLGSGLAGVRSISVAPAPGLGAAMSTTAFSRAGLDRIHDLMAGYVNREEIPGIVALVSRKGELHVDAIGSLSKPVRRRRTRILAGGSTGLRRQNRRGPICPFASLASKR